MKPETISGTIAGGWRRAALDQLLVATRRAAFERLSSILKHATPGPVLITGEPGAGKSLLVEHLLNDLATPCVPVHITLTRSVEPLEFLGMIAATLGASASGTLSLPRVQVARLLRSELADQRRTVLIIDQPHRASAAVWEEIDGLVDQVGRPGGFATMILTADTELVATLNSRTTRSLLTSLAAHVHLPPLDLDEVDELLASQHHLTDDGRLFQNLLRESRGNPRRLLRLVEQKSLSSSAGRVNLATNSQHTFARVAADTERDSPDRTWDFIAEPLSGEEYPVVEPDQSQGDSIGSGQAPQFNDHDSRHEDRESFSSAQPEFTPAAHSQALLPVRPPLRVEDGLVEVGWDGGADTELSRDDVLDPLDQSMHSGSFAPVSDATATGDNRSHAWSGYGADPLDDETDNAVAGRGALIRLESASEFPPYSHLFSRVRQANQD